MAFPTVVATSISTGNSSGISVSLPAGTTAGDMLVLIGAFDGGGVADTEHDIFVVEAGWTRAALSSAQNFMSAAAFWKVATGSDAATVDLSGNAAAETGNVIALRITGHGGQVEVGAWNNYAGGGTVSAIPDPSSLTPSWGAADTLWIAAAAWDNASRALSSYPANYTANQVYANGANSSANVGTVAATRQLNAATEDPGVFTISADEQWAAFTIAIKPEGSGGSGVSTTISATTAPAVASVTGSVGSAGVSTTISATTAPAQVALTGVAGSASGNIRLSLGIQRERGGYASSLASLKWLVFNADHTAVIASGSTLTTDANGNAVIDVNGTSYAAGEYVPVLVTDYNAATAPQDRVVRTFFGFVPAQAQP